MQIVLYIDRGSSMNIKDIATIAHVGVSTVSRVINNHPDVNDQTREKILQIIKENNYIPNNSARILKQSITKNVGILVKGVFNPFFSEILKYISSDIQKAGYTMILQHHNNKSDVKTLLGFIKEKRLQGVICLGGNFIDLKDEDLEEANIPIVLVSVEAATRKNLKRCSSISINNVLASFTATEYLIQNGHKHIGILLSDKQDYGISRERLNGYKNALSKYHIRFTSRYVTYGNYEFEDAYNSTLQLLQTQPEITAIFAISDIMAIGAAKACIHLNRVLGETISIIGFDGMDMAKYYEHSITTIKQPKRKISALSVKLLLDLLDKKTENKHILLDVQLVEGESCAKLKKQ